MTTQIRSIAYSRILLQLAFVMISFLLTYQFGYLLSNDTEAISIIATIFSILAGVLIAVISILGDPSMILDQTWRHGTISIKENQRKLHRQNDLFVLYVLLLGSLFVFSVVPKEAENAYYYVQHGVFFLVTFSFFASLSLPYSLMAIQRKRLDKSIKIMKEKQHTGSK